jgi:hypothetical protein
MVVDVWCYGAVLFPIDLGKFFKVNGIINYTKYPDILAKEPGCFCHETKLGHKWIFQQDNDPKYISKSTKKLLIDHKIHILQWPSWSWTPTLLFELKRSVHKCKPLDIKDLERLEEWPKILPNVFFNLMQKKCKG